MLIFLKIHSEKKCLFRFCLFSELAHYSSIIEYSLSTEAVFKNFWCFAYMYDCRPCAFPVPIVARKGHQITWNCCNRQLWTSMCTLGVKLRSPGRATSALNHFSSPRLNIFYIILDIPFISLWCLIALMTIHWTLWYVCWIPVLCVPLCLIINQCM